MRWERRIFGVVTCRRFEGWRSAMDTTSNGKAVSLSDSDERPFFESGITERAD
jgi:hypothetical protein